MHVSKKRAATRGQMEAEISDAVTRFEKEFTGRGPLETKTYIVDDMVITRLKGVLTQAEIKLGRSDHNSRGRGLIKQLRIELLESGRPQLEAVIKTITRRKLRSLHTDISTDKGEQLIIFVLDRPADFA